MRRGLLYSLPRRNKMLSLRLRRRIKSKQRRAAFISRPFMCLEAYDFVVKFILQSPKKSLKCVCTHDGLLLFQMKKFSREI